SFGLVCIGSVFSAFFCFCQNVKHIGVSLFSKNGEPGPTCLIVWNLIVFHPVSVHIVVKICFWTYCGIHVCKNNSVWFRICYSHISFFFTSGCGYCNYCKGQ